MSEIRFQVPGPAVPQLGARVFTPPGGRPMLRANPKTRKYQKTVARLAAMVAPSQLWTGPLEVRLLVEREPLKSWSKTKTAAALRGEVYPTTKPDNDNVAKSVCDAMTGIIYEDDAQICRLLVVKRYAAASRVVINVIQIHEDESEQLRGPFAGFER